MKIANIMLGRNRGGIEQSLLDYNEALLLAGHHVLAITDDKAAISGDIRIHENCQHIAIKQANQWDFFAKLRLKKQLQAFQPDATILHGNRAITLTHGLKSHTGKRIGVTHNYRLKHFKKLDFVFAITKDLQAAALKAGVSPTNIRVIANMIRLDNASREFSPNENIDGTPIVIGAMGRFVEKKGFDHLLHAIAKLKTMTRAHLKLIIGGDGELAETLHKQVAELKLEKDVEFIGWVENKAKFFKRCDIFCLPSLHEPFGIVLLEAMAHGVPIVAYESEGPKDIFKNHPESGLKVPLGDTGKLAETLERLLHNPAQRDYLAKNAYQTAKDYYSLEVISQKIDHALKDSCGL